MHVDYFSYVTQTGLDQFNLNFTQSGLIYQGVVSLNRSFDFFPVSKWPYIFDDTTKKY